MKWQHIAIGSGAAYLLFSMFRMQQEDIDLDNPPSAFTDPLNAVAILALVAGATKVLSR